MCCMDMCVSENRTCSLIMSPLSVLNMLVCNKAKLLEGLLAADSADESEHSAHYCDVGIEMPRTMFCAWQGQKKVLFNHWLTWKGQGLQQLNVTNETASGEGSFWQTGKKTLSEWGLISLRRQKDMYLPSISQSSSQFLAFPASNKDLHGLSFPQKIQWVDCIFQLCKLW